MREQEQDKLIIKIILKFAGKVNSLGGDETPGPHAPCVRRGCVNEYSHLLNGSAEACLQPPRVGDASVMLNEDMESSGNHV